MGTILIDSGELLNHSTDDGNTLTEIDGVVMQKELYSDVVGEVIDAVHLSESTFRERAAAGTVAESGGLQTFTMPSNLIKSKGLTTAAVFNDGVFTIDFNELAVAGNNQDYGLTLRVDGDNSFTWLYFIPTNTLFWVAEIGGVSTQDSFVIADVTTLSLRLTRAGNNFTVEHNIGAGWVNNGTITKAIGADASLEWGASVGGGGGGSITVTANNISATGTGVYWDQKSDTSEIKTTYNQQSVGAGDTIQFGSGTFTEGSNMTYDYKIGSGGWVLGRTSTQIIALGDQVTDTGTFDLRAVYGGGTAQASWTSFSVPTVAAAVGIPIPLLMQQTVGAL